MDPRAVEAAIGPKTRAIIPVHLACNMADMDALPALAERRGLVLIEDCAHAHGARWRGRGAGSIGQMGSFSFQTTKLLTAGEGGIVLTSDATLEKKLQSIVNCGRKEPGYDDFEGSFLGHNYRITEWQAALLAVQLDRLEEQTERRIARTRLLEEKLRGMRGIAFTKQDARNDRRAAYQFIVKYDREGFAGVPRDRFLEALKAEGVPCSGQFYIPLYKSPLLPPEKAKYRATPCPVAEKAAYEEAIWLPHQLFLDGEDDVDDIAKAFAKLQEHAGDLRA
jgi:dTDP-4-amino-4,6-dideoxygalactose transaminase